MADKLTHARAGGPPANWEEYEVVNAKGTVIENVLEVNTVTGVALVSDEDGSGRFMYADGLMIINCRRIEGKFRIRKIGEE